MDEVKSAAVVNKSTLGYSGKNLFDWDVKNTAQKFYITITNETDATISISSTTRWSRISYKLPTLEIGNAVLKHVVF